MANTIKVKRSAVPGKVPTTSDLQLGELAIATYDGKLYLKRDNGTESIVEIGAGSSFSGSYNDLTNKPSIPSALDDLSDVAISSPSSGQVLKYNGSSWANAADSTFSGSYTDLTDKPSLATVATSGAYSDLSGAPSLASVATSGSYADLTNKPTIPSSLDDLSDVAITTPSNGQVLKYNGTVWANATDSTFSGSYTDLTNKPSFATVATSGAYSDLSGIPTLATVATSGLYADLLSKPSLATVATSGAYSDLSGTPTLATVATTGSYSDLLSKPTLATVATSGSYADLTNKPTVPSTLDDLSDVVISTPSTGQVLKYNGSSWANAADSTFSGSYTDLTNKPSFATVATSGAYSDLSGKPTLATVATSGSYTDLTNKPSLATVATSGSYSDLSNKPTIPSALDDLSDVVVTSAAKGQFIVHNGTSFINSRTIEADAATTKPLILKGAASQSANLLEAQNSSATSIFSVGYGGALYAAGAITTDGAITPSNSGFGPKLWNGGQGYSIGLGYGSTVSGSYAIAIGTNAAAGANGLKVSWGYGGVSAVGGNITGLSSGNCGVNETSPGGSLQVTAYAAGVKGFIVKAAASQTANLFEAQNSSGTALVSISSAGAISTSSTLSTTGGITCGGTFTINTNAITSSTDINLTPGSTADRVIFNNLGTTGTSANAVFGSNGGLVKSTSSLRYKTDIETLDPSAAEAVFDALRAVRYKSLASEDPQDVKFYGLVAEEVAEVEPMLVAWANIPSVSETELVPDGVNYDRLGVLLIPIVQKQRQKIAELEARLAAIEAAIAK